ncbi:MAG: hypothetical protein IPJ98_10535 [Bryobacterales bacterium]|nr:hypothetical protein [Bryobacterales bacterium]
MALDLISVSALVCERFLAEEDHVFSAIRIVDIFYVPMPPPSQAQDLPVQIIPVYVLIFIKAWNAGEVGFRLRLKKPSGEEKVFDAPQVPQRIEISPRHPEPGLPLGASIGLTIHVRSSDLGTHVLLIEVDGKTEAKVPFTLLAQQSKQG